MLLNETLQQECTDPRRPRFARWNLIFVCPEYGTCSHHPFCTQNFEVAFRFSGNFYIRALQLLVTMRLFSRTSVVYAICCTNTHIERALKDFSPNTYFLQPHLSVSFVIQTDAAVELLCDGVQWALYHRQHYLKGVSLPPVWTTP